MYVYSKRFMLFGLASLLTILPACSRQTPTELRKRGKIQIATGAALASVASGAAIAGGSTVVEVGLGPVPVTVELAHALYFLLPLAIIAAPIAIALIVCGNEDCKEARKMRKQAKLAKSLAKDVKEMPKIERKAVKYTYAKVAEKGNPAAIKSA